MIDGFISFGLNKFGWLTLAVYDAADLSRVHRCSREALEEGELQKLGWGGKILHARVIAQQLAATLGRLNMHYGEK